MKKILLSLITILALAATPALAEQWTNALGDNDFSNWNNWVLDDLVTIPNSWNAVSSQNWQVNLAGADKAIVGPGQTVTGVNRNVLVADGEWGLLQVPPIPSQVGELLIDGGTLSINRNMRIGRLAGTGSGTVTVTGGGVLNLGYGLYVGQDGNAGSFFNLIDGTVNVSPGRTDGISIGHREFGDGTLNISGGQLNVKGGDAYFSASGNAGVATSALNLSGTGALNVEAGNIIFGGNTSGVSGSVTVAVSISDTASLNAGSVRFAESTDSAATLTLSGGEIVARSNVRIGFGASSTVTLDISGGTLDNALGFMTLGQAAGAQMDVTMTGGEINADRMIFANFGAVAGDPDAEPPIPAQDAATVTLTMTGGTINVARSGSSTATTTGVFQLAAGVSDLDISGDAVVNTEKLWFADGGLLTLSGDAQVKVAGSTDGLNPTLDIVGAFILDDWSGVLGQIVFNGGSLRIAGATDPVNGVNYVDLLTAAIAEGVITTDVADVVVVAEYVSGPPLPVLQIAPADTDLTIAWNQPAGQIAQLQYNSDLGTAWVPTGIFETAGEPESLDYTDTTWDAQAPRFYRLSGGYTHLVLEPVLVM